MTVGSLVLLWACSNAAPYGGGGRDLGPQAAPMNTNAEGGPEGSTDSGTDTGTDTGVADTGVGG